MSSYLISTDECISFGRCVGMIGSTDGADTMADREIGVVADELVDRLVMILSLAKWALRI